MGTLLTPIAFDIETSGFAVDDRVTTIGFGLPLGCRVLLETGDRTVDTERLAGAVEDRTETRINLSIHKSESALLETLGTVLSETVAPQEYLLVAYNGERWSGGFDLPFLRTRHSAHDLPWQFDGVPYADLMPIITDRFNTTVDGSARTDLVGAYESLVGGPLTDADPFEESEEAVTAHATGDFEALVAHNVADVERTRVLATLAQRYCARSDFDVKSLTAASRDPALVRPD